MLVLSPPRVSARSGRVAMGAAGAQQHPGHPAFPWRVRRASHPLTLRKTERAFLHREEEKRPMNVIFYLLFSVG